jgi:GTP-binding protein EngB required for normal cell division
MRLNRTARTVLVIVVVLAVLGLSATAINLAGSLMDVWQRLREGSLPVFVGLIIFLVAVALLGGWAVWRLIVPSPRRRSQSPRQVVDRESLERRIREAQASGLDLGDAERELEELARRREAGGLYLCFFGEISTGKSSLIKAVAPEAQVETGVVGGTTRSPRHYTWQTPSGDDVILVDVPGSSLDAEDDETGMREAVRAHVVIYVCSADLTRRQYEDLQALVAIEKPMTLVLNKSDLLSGEEATLIQERLRLRLQEIGAGDDVELVVVSARPDDESQPAGIDDLRSAIQRRVDHSPEALEVLRDRAVFSMVDRRLTEAEQERRRTEAEKIVRSYTRKAVVGALAAVSPGTDILIQGYLGSALVKELCRLYDVPARDVEISRLLDLSQSYVGRTLPIALAVAGNAMKAFPGAGTIAGGVTHAVAYGLIFDALGRGLSRSLAEGGELRPAAAARRFRESMSEDLGARTIRIARMALEEEEPGRRDQS